MRCTSPQQLRARSGFTLVEILVVIIILAALALIALPSLLGQRDKAKDSQTRANITNTYKALKAEYATGELYSTATVTSAIAGEPSIPAIMVTGGSAFAYPDNKIEVSLLNSQTVVVAGKAASGKKFLLAAKEQGDSAGVIRVMESNKFLSLNTLTNLVPNPSAEAGSATPTGWWTDAWGTLTRVNSWAKRGSWSGALTGTLNTTNNYVNFNTQSTGVGSVTPGNQYTVGAWVYVTAQPANCIFRVSVNWYTAADGYLGSTSSANVVSPANRSPLYITTTLTAPATSNYGVALVQAVRGGTDGVVSYQVDGVSFVPGTTIGDFDGDSPGASWTGTPHASASTGYGGPSW